MKILLHGLNYAPEQLGIGKYSGEMMEELAQMGCNVDVVTTPPYYPHWKIKDGYSGFRYRVEYDNQNGKRGKIRVTRCPLWVPSKVSGLKRIVHLASFGLSSVPIVLWRALTQRPDIIMTVEPAAFCLPTTWLAAKLCGAKTWLHVQDFEVDAAFELGILKQPLLKKMVSAIESFLMRRFDRVSSISPNMVTKLREKGVELQRCRLFPNWVDSNQIKPLSNPTQYRSQFSIPEDKCIAMYAGNVGAKQGLEIIAEAAKLAVKHENLHFVICGTGAAFPNIEEAVSGLSNVQLLPPQPFSKFNELMNCADIHLLPQLSGAADLVMPSKLTGMLSSGRPVVACADSGTQIDSAVVGHGISVPPGCVKSFHAAIVRLASSPDLRIQYGSQGRDYAVKQFGKTSILGQFHSELSKLRFKSSSTRSVPNQRSKKAHQVPPSPHLRRERASEDSHSRS